MDVFLPKALSGIVSWLLQMGVAILGEVFVGAAFASTVSSAVLFAMMQAGPLFWLCHKAAVLCGRIRGITSQAQVSWASMHQLCEYTMQNNMSRVLNCSAG
jgi:hypothetical protein